MHRRARRDLPFSEAEPKTIEKESAFSDFETKDNAVEAEEEASVSTNPERDENPQGDGFQNDWNTDHEGSPFQPMRNAPKAEEAFSSAANLFDWLKSFLFSLAAVIFIFTLVFRGVTVSGDSMLPTLVDKEYLIISNLLYTPETGDIVVVQSPSYKNGTEPLIKRIIATGGQTLKINFKTWQVWVDGVELKEDYIAFEEGITMNCEDMEPDEEGFAEIVVEDHCVFVMGDHRNDSLDSRSNAVGQIDERYIMGRVLIRVTPLSKFGKVA